MVSAMLQMSWAKVLRWRSAPLTRSQMAARSTARPGGVRLVERVEGLGDGLLSPLQSSALNALRRGLAPRERAHEVFARLRVWDTEANNGVLLYLLLADHAIEIVADRGLEGRVSGEEWEQVCRAVEAAIAGGDALEPAVIAGIGRISALLATHWPATGAGRDELPDRPVLL